MSRVRDLLRRSFRGGQDVDAELRQMGERVTDLDQRTAVELDRHETSVRQLTADLVERITALEQRLGALEARSQDQ